MPGNRRKKQNGQQAGKKHVETMAMFNVLPKDGFKYVWIVSLVSVMPAHYLPLNGQLISTPAPVRR